MCSMKKLALPLVIVVVAGVFLIYGNYEPKSESEVIGESEVTEMSEQSGIFNGYYEGISRQGWEETETCRTLVVSDGHAGLIKYFKDMILLDGNTVQTLSSEGNLRINLPWNEISESDRLTIQSSTKNKNVSVELKKKIQVPMGAGPCTSFFNFIRVN